MIACKLDSVMKKVELFFGTVAVLCLLSACATSNTSRPLSTQEISAALSVADRSESDKKRDATRKPEQVLSFFGLSSGMKVLDLYSGGGYYTEIVSNLVGSDGHVDAHNNAAYRQFAKGEIATRYTDGRLTNVTALRAENNQLTLSPATYDTVLLILGYHDIYYVDEKNGWPQIDRDKLLAELYKALKPGGVFGVVDHSAVSGAPASVGATLHRIDPQRARNEISRAGFVFEDSSDVLLNPDDMLDKAMFDPLVKGKTSRFIYRFRKP